jgi:N-hydroxyarylamine O-acetyltransferase
MPGRLSRDLVERVLEAFGLPAMPAPDLAGLRALYGAWSRHVPFDNIRKLIAVRSGDTGPLPGDDPAEFLEQWLAHRVGGTCWAGNGALAELLGHCGFAARRGVATMMVAPGLPPNHGTVIVEVPEGRYITDASILHVEPLAVVPGEASAIGHPAWGVTGRWNDGHFDIEWRPVNRTDRIECRVNEWAVDGGRFRAQHEATRAWSPFNFELTFNIVRGDGRLGAALGQRILLTRHGVEAGPIADRMAFLVDECGVSEAMAARVPEDVPTPPPPGSRTAAAQAAAGPDA